MHEQGDKAAQAADIIESSSRKVEAAEAKVEGKQFANSTVSPYPFYTLRKDKHSPLNNANVKDS